MARKPGSMYRDIDKRAYTRREYIDGVPGSKITQFDMGDIPADDDEYPVALSLTADEACQIRHSALESARVAANRHMIKELGEANYKMVLRVHPHHVLRENKQATGAGADRVSDGMRQSFGKPVGTAARVRKGQTIYTARVNPSREEFEVAKDALRRAYTKIPCPCTVNVEEGEDLIRE
ncbi:MAG: 50S ribosomal protein L16 [Halobacteria archaeon]|nr:50S ribosomal protein L16 [Halobacteria archaeon]